MKWSSWDAYNAIVGELPEARRCVFRQLMKHGGHTGRELNEVMGSQSAHKRLSELERQGLVEDAGTRECRVTGHIAHVWAIVGEDRILDSVSEDGIVSLPRATAPTRAELLAEIDQLRLQVARMEATIADMHAPRRRDAHSAIDQFLRPGFDDLRGRILEKLPQREQLSLLPGGES